MSKQCVTIHPYFEVAEGKLEEFKAIWKAMVPIVQNEEKCQFYEFSVKGNTIFCREGYDDAEGVLTHVGNVGGALQQAAEISTTARFEVHGPASELDKLRGPMSHLPVEFYEVEFGFRK